jgi:alanyl-tRNA synthetase
MEFDLADDGTLTPLPQQNIDTGMGLERAAMLMQGVDSLFDIDTFQPLLDWIGERASAAYGSSDEATKALPRHRRARADCGVPRRRGRAPFERGPRLRAPPR